MQSDILIIEHDRFGWTAHPWATEPTALSGPTAEISSELLIEFASRTQRHFGPDAARCTILLIERSSRQQVHRTRDGAGVIVLMSPVLALAYLAPTVWERFLVLDLGEPCTASLITRHGEELSEERLTGTEPDRLLDLVKLLGINHVLARSVGVDDDRLAYLSSAAGLTIEPLLGAKAHIKGARMAANQLSDGPGVWQIAPGHTRMKVKRTASYDLFRPKTSTFDCVDDTLGSICDSRPVFFVIDRSIDKLHGSAIRRYGEKRLNVLESFVCAGTETEKTMEMAEEICRMALKAGLRRDGIVIGVGGGVTLDVAGFAASILRRGVRYVRVPTTLIGLVDVSVGVKHAVNAFGTKNVLGSFYPPLACVLDYEFLKTLPSPCIAAGFSEIIKMAILCDGHLLREIERYGVSLTRSHFQHPKDAGIRIAESAELLMMQELAPNLFEDNLARLVDFGHTFSPIIEIDSEFRVSHGQAVGLDMLLSTAIAADRGICAVSLFERLSRLLGSLGLPIWHREMPSPVRLADALAKAREHRGGALNLVVPRSAGAATFIQDLGLDELMKASNSLQQAASGVMPTSKQHARRSDYGSSLSV